MVLDELVVLDGSVVLAAGVSAGVTGEIGTGGSGTGTRWMVTVVYAGALFTPRLFVTTSANVTVPEVFGTVTETLDCGAGVVTDG